MKVIESCGSSWLGVVLLGYSRPWVLTGTHQRAVTSKQDDGTAEGQSFVVGVVVKSCGHGCGHHGEMICREHSVNG